MTTTNKYRIETRNQNNNLNNAWTADGIGDQNEFETAAEARAAVHTLRSYGDSWAKAEYRLVGPQGIESAEMDGPAWQRIIDAQLVRLGLAAPSLGRSSWVCNIDPDDLSVTLSDNGADWCQDADPEEVVAILEAIDAEQDADEIREELASELQAQ